MFAGLSLSPSRYNLRRRVRDVHTAHLLLATVPVSIHAFLRSARSVKYACSQHCQTPTGVGTRVYMRINIVKSQRRSRKYAYTQE
jgi:hypothetical protein